MDSTISHTTFPLLELPGELRDMVYEQVLFASTVGDFGITLGVKIHTNILLTSRQVFEEARNAIIRAQLVQVIGHGQIPLDWMIAAFREDRIPLFQPRYRKFCLLRHRSEYP